MTRLSELRSVLEPEVLEAAKLGDVSTDQSTPVRESFSNRE